MPATLKTMRDDMPLLANVDLGGTKIVYYYGTGGTSISPGNQEYIEDFIPQWAFQYKYSLTSIVFPPTIKSIQNHSFVLCYNLASISFPETLVSIATYAFSNCKKLSSLVFPSSLVNIGSYSFSFCYGITGDLKIPPFVTSLGNGAFSNDTNIVSVFIPSSITTFEGNVFGGCKGISSITVASPIPFNLVNSNSVFRGVDVHGCILSVPFGTSAEYRAANQWGDFTYIQEIPNAVPSIDALNFYGKVASVKSIYIASGLAWNAQTDANWLSITPNSGATSDSVDFAVQANPTNLPRTANVNIKVSGYDDKIIKITQFGNTFVSPGDLKIMLGDSLALMKKLKLSGTIDARDFKTMRDNMPLLTDIDISEASISGYFGTAGTITGDYPYKRNEIPMHSFYSFTGISKTGLKSIIFPETLMSIEGNAFKGCSGLTTFNLPKNVKSIADWTFSGTGCFFTVDPANKYFSASEGVLYDKEQKTLFLCPTSRTGTFTAPSTIDTIGAYAFYNCLSLTSILLPEGLLHIGNSAFRSCKWVNNISLGNRLQGIGEYAFYDCWQLSSISLPATVKKIESKAFETTSASDLDTIIANPIVPVDLSSSTTVFKGIYVNSCKLLVPPGSRTKYVLANQWTSFLSYIIEMAGVFPSAKYVDFDSLSGSKKIYVASSTPWTASPGEGWISLNIAGSSINDSLTISVGDNPTNKVRVDTITLSSPGNSNKFVIVTQDAGAGIQQNLSLDNITVTSEQTTCFNAYDTITVAGNGNQVIFQSGSMVDLVAGRSIVLLPGFHASEGSIVNMRITTNSSFCNNDKSATILDAVIADTNVGNLNNGEGIQTDNTDFKIFPNPNNGRFTLDVINGETGSVIRIFSATGSEVYKSIIGEEQSYKIDLNGLDRGLYIVTLSDKRHQKSKKIIVE